MNYFSNIDRTSTYITRRSKRLIKKNEITLYPTGIFICRWNFIRRHFWYQFHCGSVASFVIQRTSAPLLDMFFLQLQSDLEEARLKLYPFKAFAHCFLNTSHIRLLLATSPSLNAFFPKIFCVWTYTFEFKPLNKLYFVNW